MDGMTRGVSAATLLPAIAIAMTAVSAAAQESTTDAAAERAAPAGIDTSEPAEAALCGGLGLAGEWVGGDSSNSDLSTLTAALDADGRIPAEGQLVRLFSLAAETDVRLEVAGRPTGDPFVTVLGADGVQVAADDDSGGDYAARVETTLAPGTYCLVARGYDSEPIDAAVRLGRADHEPLTASEGENLSCMSDALPALGGGPLDGDALAAGVRVSSTAGRTPAWSLTLATPTTLTVSARSSSGDPVLTLRDENGSVLAENDDAEGTNSRIDVPRELPAGEYCVQLDDLGGPDNMIDVALAPYDPVAARLRQIEAGDFAPLAADEVPVRTLGSVETSLISDVAVSDKAEWLSFEMPEDGLLLIEAIGQGVDPMIVLFDRVGRRLAENDDGSSGLDSLLAERLRAGTYRVAVKLANGQDAIGNVRVLLERYLPAK